MHHAGFVHLEERDGDVRRDHRRRARAPRSSRPRGERTLVAVAVGGTCGFSVNGAFKGSGSSLKLELFLAGTYSVTCKPGDGSALKSRSVIIKGGDTAMAMFKLAP